MGIFLRAIAVLLLLTTQAGAAVPHAPRSVELLSDGWRFTKGDPQGAEQTGFDDRAWRAVTVPHDYSIKGPVAIDNPSGATGGFFPGGIGWYRNTLQITKIDGTKRRFIVFDGVMANSDVWVNGHHLGRRPNGYVSFVYEFTAHLCFGANVIAVRCDNAKEPSLRWYLGGGIHRQVRLVTTGATHIAPWGTFVTTPVVADQQASIHVRSTVSSPVGGKVALAVTLTGPDGKVVASVTSATRALMAGQSLDLEVDASVIRPQRWALEKPSMYTARVTLLHDGEAVGSEEVPFGIRTFRFDACEGFFLSWRAMKIYGVGVHSDGGALGAAVPLAVWQRRLLALRKLGVNDIRTAHNAAAPEFLDLCDRMGFLVLDEFFDMWTLPKVPYDYSVFFKEWAERDTADLVRRDRNHPSIIFYSVGNEIRDTTVPAVAVEWLKRLLRVHHDNDPTRPVPRKNVRECYTDPRQACLHRGNAQSHRHRRAADGWQAGTRQAQPRERQ